MERSLFRVAALVVALMAGRSAQAQEVVAPPAMPAQPGADLAVRVAGTAMVFAPVGIGLEVSARLMPRFGLDFSVAFQDFDHGYHGVAVEALARAFPIGDRHSLSLGIGPSLTVGDGFGVVTFLQTEVAYEFRARHGWSVLTGLGPAVVLNQSSRAQCPESGWFSCFLWKDHYDRGDVAVRFRVAIGFGL